MCEDCCHAFCPPDCPYHVGGKEEPSCCEICGEVLFPDSDCYASGGRYVCGACAESLTVEEAILLGGLRDAGDLLALLGYRRVL